MAADPSSARSFLLQRVQPALTGLIDVLALDPGGERRPTTARLRDLPRVRPSAQRTGRSVPMNDLAIRTTKGAIMQRTRLDQIEGRFR